jgi:hypothetical protein
MGDDHERTLHLLVVEHLSPLAPSQAPALR